MHYSSYSFSSNGFPTIITRAGALIPEHYDYELVSNTDVTSLRKAYGCKLVSLGLSAFKLMILFKLEYLNMVFLNSQPKAGNFIKTLNKMLL